MSLRIRRGTDEQRSGIVFDLAEPIWVTNTHKLYIGDGTTEGGASIIAEYAGTGLQYNSVNDTLEIANFVANSDDVEEGSNNLYFTAIRAQDATAALFNAGTHTNISYTYDDVAHAINSSVIIGSELVQDSVAPLFVNGIHSGITFQYDDLGNRINATVSLSQEDVSDLIAPLFTGGAHSGISFQYDDFNNKINATVSLSQEDVADLIAPVFTQGNNYGVFVEYQDFENRINLSLDSEVVQDITATLFMNGIHSGVNVMYDDNSNRIDLTVTGISVINDLAPELGGDLDLNGFDIIGAGNVSIAGGLNLLDDVFCGAMGIASGRITSLNSIKLEGSHTVMYAPTDGDIINPGWIDFSTYKGTLESPINLDPGDYGSSLLFKSYFDNDYRITAVLSTILTDDATLNAIGVPGVPCKVELFVKSNNTNTGGAIYNFNSDGSFNAPVIQPNSYLSTEIRNALIPYPKPGMMIFVERDGLQTDLLGDTTLGSDIVLTTSATTDMIGAAIFGNPINFGTTVVNAVAGVSLTISSPATASETGSSITVIEGVPKFQGCTNAGSGIIGDPGYVPPTWVNLN